MAFIGNHRPEELAVDNDLYKLPVKDGEPELLTGGFNRSLLMGIGSDLRVSTPGDGPVWSSDGEYIYFNTADTPYCNLYRINIGNKKLETIVSGKTVDGFSVADNGVDRLQRHDITRTMRTILVGWRREEAQRL